MAHNVRISLNGRDYLWTGKEWCDARTFTAPHQTLVRELNARLEEQLAGEDSAISNVAVLIERAGAARDALQHSRAEKLVRRALKLAPGNLATLTVLCSILRARGRPQQALAETDAFKRESHPPLLTSRAAALCDLRRWEEAKREIGRALAIAGSEEAFSVMRRIKAARQELY